MASSSIRPNMLVADADGNIFDHPDLLMVCRHGTEMALPRPDELMPLPEGSDLFMLPGRRAVGLDPETGEAEVMEEFAVAAFAAPAHTLTAHPAYVTQPEAPVLPLFAYGAVGFANGRFYVCAKRVDQDTRQVFTNIPCDRIERNAHALIKRYPSNRLMQHIMANCVLTYSCPAARNLALGRYEAPLPTSRACNARCVGCISQQEEDSPICTTPQNRLTFTPTADEIAEVMLHHNAKERTRPIYSFGQGCEGEPLTEAPLLEAAIRLFRSKGGTGTVNMNTNASMPDAVARLCDAGLSSIRVSMNSAREEVYNRYYRPRGYTFAQVRQSILEAKARGKWVSINLLFFPGITDSEPEVEALIALAQETRLDFMQLRNLNIDPEMYLELFHGISFGPCTGFTAFRKRLRKECPWLQFGYFNPFVPADAIPGAPATSATATAPGTPGETPPVPDSLPEA